MEKIREVASLAVVLVGLAAVPLGIRYYDEVVIPSQYEPGTKLVRLTADTKGWTTERIAAYNYRRRAFAPARIELQKGEPVALRIVSSDVYHGFGVRMPGLRIVENVRPGQLTEVRFTPQRAGVYDFRCTVKCGETHDEMAKSLVVKGGEIAVR